MARKSKAAAEIDAQARALADQLKEGEAATGAPAEGADGQAADEAAGEASDEDVGEGETGEGGANSNADADAEGAEEEADAEVAALTSAGDTEAEADVEVEGRDDWLEFEPDGALIQEAHLTANLPVKYKPQGKDVAVVERLKVWLGETANLFASFDCEADTEVADLVENIRHATRELTQRF